MIWVDLAKSLIGAFAAVDYQLVDEITSDDFCIKWFNNKDTLQTPKKKVISDMKEHKNEKDNISILRVAYNNKTVFLETFAKVSDIRSVSIVKINSEGKISELVLYG